MNINDIITLDNEIDYLILDKIEYNHDNYLYSVKVDNNDIPQDEYIYLKEINDNNDIYVEEVTDEILLKNLITLFTNNYLRDSIFTNEEQDV